MALTKQSIIEKISKKNNQSPSQAKDTLETLLEIMKSTLAWDTDQTGYKKSAKAN